MPRSQETEEWPLDDELLTPSSCCDGSEVQLEMPTDNEAACKLLEKEILNHCHALHPGPNLMILHMRSDDVAKSAPISDYTSHIVYEQDSTYVCLHAATERLRKRYLGDPYWSRRAVLVKLLAQVKQELFYKYGRPISSEELDMYAAPLKDDDAAIKNDDAATETIVNVEIPETREDAVAEESYEILKREILTYTSITYPNIDIEFAFHTASYDRRDDNGEMLVECFAQVLSTNALKGCKNGSSRFQIFESHRQFRKEHYLKFLHWCQAALLRELWEKAKYAMHVKFSPTWLDRLTDEAQGLSMLPRTPYKVEKTDG